ncbi:MarR family winged helix-turn-helix transcriptional regulator [Erysipelothrix urinaevulpis]|uniref:MarR family winged helix-turn-helix transcriptional regulator n=1 Tax=Erysipelothrix urinaevulpis TaxID=2683717 RepID=UPI00135796EC|nr:MarR family transcriptional regulator [Erysipelothrix urinaevulpis]
MSVDTRRQVNELIVDIFNKILTLEETYHHMHGIDLSMTEIHTLDAIHKSASKQMSDVAKSLDITQGTLTTSINRLEKQGYVNRVRDQEDRRIYRLVLEDKSFKVLDIHDKFHNEMVEGILRQTEKDEDLVRAIAELNGFFQNMLEENQ